MVGFDILTNSNEFHADGMFNVCFACEMGLFQKVMTHKLCQNANFWKRGYHFSSKHPACTAEHFVNIFTAKGTWHVFHFLDAKRVVMSFYVLKKMIKMQMTG